MSDDVRGRVRRIYAAIGETVEEDLSKFEPSVSETPTGRVILMDFSGGMSPDQMANVAHSSIANVASLRDHLKGWARRNSKDPAVVDRAVVGSFELKVLIDLWNADKHGPPRDGGLSGKTPKLTEIHRVMRLRAGPAPNSGATVTFNPNASLRVVGEASGAVVVDGLIVDGLGAAIGFLSEFTEAALKAWINVLGDLGVTI